MEITRGISGFVENDSAFGAAIACTDPMEDSLGAPRGSWRCIGNDFDLAFGAAIAFTGLTEDALGAATGCNSCAKTGLDAWGNNFAFGSKSGRFGSIEGDGDAAIGCNAAVKTGSGSFERSFARDSSIGRGFAERCASGSGLGADFFGDNSAVEAVLSGFGSSEADVADLGSSGAIRVAVASATPVNKTVKLPTEITFPRTFRCIYSAPPRFK